MFILQSCKTWKGWLERNEEDHHWPWSRGSSLLSDDSYTRTPNLTVCWMMLCRQTDDIEEEEWIGFRSQRTATCCIQAASFHVVHCPWGAKTGIHTVFRLLIISSLSWQINALSPVFFRSSRSDRPSMEDVCQLRGAVFLPPPPSLPASSLLILSACADCLGDQPWVQVGTGPLGWAWPSLSYTLSRRPIWIQIKMSMNKM